LSVSCASNLSDKPDIFLTGAIRRLSKNPELEKQLRTVKSEKYLVTSDLTG
jgi:hypothetical protein